MLAAATTVLSSIARRPACVWKLFTLISCTLICTLRTAASTWRRDLPQSSGFCQDCYRVLRGSGSGMPYSRHSGAQVYSRTTRCRQSASLLRQPTISHSNKRQHHPCPSARRKEHLALYRRVVFGGAERVWQSTCAAKGLLQRTPVSYLHCGFPSRQIQKTPSPGGGAAFHGVRCPRSGGPGAQQVECRE